MTGDQRPEPPTPPIPQGPHLVDDDDELLDIAGSPEPGVIAILDLQKKRVGDTTIYVPRKTISNVERVLESDSRQVGRYMYNELLEAVTADGIPITDELESGVRRWMDDVYDIAISTIAVSEAVRYVASEHRYHPVADYLSGLTWDGTPRAGRLLIDYFGARETPLRRAIGARWLISAVARTYDPGCKVDTTLVLVGEQGERKSTAFEALAVQGDWFSDSMIDMSSKDAYQSLSGVWIYELGELSSIRRSDANALKAFLSSKIDKYRASYGRNQKRAPRRCVIVGTTNDAQFLSDPTGSRRFWPINVGTIDLERIRADRDQLWAEAVHLYMSGMQWWLTDEETADLIDESAEYQHVDPWLYPVSDWLVGRMSTHISEVLTEALEKPHDRQTRGDAMRMSSVLRAAGWRKYERVRRDGDRVFIWRRR